MRERPLHILFAILTVSTSALHAVAHHDPIGLLQIVNNHNLPCEERVAAEAHLMAIGHDVHFMRRVFGVLEAPVGERGLSIEAAYVGTPGTGSAERDCYFGMPATAHIAYARMRLWQHVARNAKPEDERMRAYARLFDEAITDFQVRSLIKEASSGTPEQYQLCGIRV